jgi:hypothetical protein
MKERKKEKRIEKERKRANEIIQTVITTANIGMSM